MQTIITATAAQAAGRKFRFIMLGMETSIAPLAITSALFVGKMAIPMDAPERRAKIIRRISLPVAAQTVTNSGTKMFRAGDTWLNAAMIKPRITAKINVTV